MRTNNVWAQRLRVGASEIHQLLVPAGDLAVVERDGLTFLESTRGCWPTRPMGQPAPSDGELFARLGRVASGRRPQLAGWEGERELRPRVEILSSYAAALRLDPGGPGLRRAQRGAEYSVLGHWESGLEEPALVVMPTGTGKTDTMIALMVAGRQIFCWWSCPPRRFARRSARRSSVSGCCRTPRAGRSAHCATPGGLSPRAWSDRDRPGPAGYAGGDDR